MMVMKTFLLVKAKPTAVTIKKTRKLQMIPAIQFGLFLPLPIPTPRSLVLMLKMMMMMMMMMIIASAIMKTKLATMKKNKDVKWREIRRNLLHLFTAVIDATILVRRRIIIIFSIIMTAITMIHPVWEATATTTTTTTKAIIIVIVIPIILLIRIISIIVPIRIIIITISNVTSTPSSFVSVTRFPVNLLVDSFAVTD